MAPAAVRVRMRKVVGRVSQCIMVVENYAGRHRPCSIPATHDIWGHTVCHIHERKIKQLAVSLLVRRDIQLDVLSLIRWSDPAVRQEVYEHLTQVDPALRDRWVRTERRKATRATEENATVYYVHRAGHIKIGYTTNLAKRMTALARGGDKRPECVGIGPVELLHHHTGGPTSERQLHEKFASLHAAGEWFRAAPELLAHIDRLKNRGVT